MLAETLQNGASAAVDTASSAASGSMASALPSLRTISKFALGGAQVLLGSGARVRGGSPLTCSNPQLSCQNHTVVEDLCCFNYPGGQLLQTQFWDTHPVTGPVDSWTIHGLWPDHCDGTYDASCDSSRSYSNISDILTAFGETETLTYMEKYWKDYSGDDASFWYHEWAKHGTCISTLSPKCYDDYVPTQEVPDFFQKTVELFKSLPSYEWLSEAGITPSSSKTYTFAEIQEALTAKHGNEVTLGCRSGALNEIWYHFDVRGSVVTGEFVSAEPDGTKSSCPKTGIKYLPKGSSGNPTTTGTATVTRTTATTAPTSTGSFSGKGHLMVEVGGSSTGCIISKGTWYTSGTCATFTAADSGDGFTLSSSKGNCGISDGALTCGSGVSEATVFMAEGGNLAVDNSTAFYADKVPSGTTQQTVYTEDRDEQLVITWKSA